MADKKEEKKKNNSVMTVLKLMIIVILLLAAVYAWYMFNDDNKNDKQAENNKKIDNKDVFDEDRIEIKTSVDELGNDVQVVYVDSKKLNLDLKNVVSIENVKVMDNIAMFNVYLLDSAFLYVLDINGNVIDRFVGKAVSSETKAIKLSGDLYRGNYDIMDNKIYIPSDNYGQDLPYNVCTSDNGSVIKYVDIYEYKDGTLVKYETQNGSTKEEIIEEENIDCNEILGQ